MDRAVAGLAKQPHGGHATGGGRERLEELVRAQPQLLADDRDRGLDDKSPVAVEADRRRASGGGRDALGLSPGPVGADVVTGAVG
jgi:hypothetical protein